MSIISTVALNVSEFEPVFTSLDSRSVIQPQIIALSSNDKLIAETLFNSLDIEASSNTFLFASEFYEDTSFTNLLAINKDFLSTISLISLDEVEVTSVVNLYAPENDTKEVNLFSFDKFSKAVFDLNLWSHSKYHNSEVLFFSQYPSVLGHEIDLVAEDGFGPRIDNEFPVSGTTYNNPIEPIYFELVDNEETNINPVTVQIYVNGTQVVLSGNPVITSGFGTTTFIPITTFKYSFEFTPFIPFSPDIPVTISGEAADITAPSGNLSFFNYSYRVWKTSDLSATIIGLPDSDSPYLFNLNPADLLTEVPVTTDVYLEVIDDHTGVDPNSVQIYINGDLVLSGVEEFLPLDYPVTVGSVAGGKGRSYNINPSTNFEFNFPVVVDVIAKDLYTPAPNELIDTYYFTTVSNDHLNADFLQVFVSGNYTDLDVQDSLPISFTGVDFKVKYFNYDDTGINTSGSYIKYNGNVLSGVSIFPVSGMTEYDVFFNIIPDYKTDCELVFHVEQTPLVSGHTVYREIPTTLLWGINYCYDPVNNLLYDKEISVISQAYDRGYKSAVGTSAYNFTTKSMPKKDLSASIVGIDVSSLDFNANYDSINPFYEYGKEMNLVLEISDYAGNKLVYPYKFTLET